MSDKQFKELKALLKKLGSGKDEGSSPSMEKIEKGDDPATRKAKMKRNKALQQQQQRAVTMKSEELRLETELSMSLFNRQESMDNLIKLEESMHDMQKEATTAYREGNVEKAEALQKEINSTGALLDKNQKL